MRPNSLMLSLAVVGTMAMPFLFTAPAQAQSTRTWVSGSGSDANPCSRTAPCQTFAAAMAKTAAGGEIDALDAGGFGVLTITQSITIDGGGGQVASILASGTNGIIVSAGANDVVVLRNLRFQGLLGNGSGGSPGLSGIVFNSGAQLIVDNCDIVGFSTDGIHIAGNGLVAVNNTRITNVGHAGIVALASSGQVEVDNVRIHGSQFGVAVAIGNKMVFSRSVSSNATNSGVEVDPGGSLFVDNSVLSYNVIGAWVSNESTFAMGNTDVTFNTTGVGGGNGTFNSYTNNRFFGNGANGTPIPLAPNPSNPSGQQ
jgi:Right handed beta helix region